MKDKNEEFTNDYCAWKNWSWKKIEQVSGSTQRYFSGEMNRISIPSNGKVLELGFGEGEFLEWARSKGYDVTGIELINSQVEEANRNGIRAFNINLATCEDKEIFQTFEENSFDAIIAFDVVEHMSPEECNTFLVCASRLLKDHGRLLFRVPNGGSPIGMVLYNGDITHKIAFTVSKVRQIITNTNFRMVFCDNAYRVTGNRFYSPMLKLAFPVRYLLEIAYSSLYFKSRVPMDPTLTIIVENSKDTGK